MSETMKLNFTYDPIYLTKLLLQMYVEQEIEGNTFQARQFALYEYLQDFTDNECEEILEKYVEQEKLDVITYDEWKNDCKIILKIIEETDRFNLLLEKFRLACVKKYDFEEAKGVSGILMPNGEFIQCGYQEHHLIANQMEWQDQLKSMYFSSPLQLGKNSDDSGIITFSPIGGYEKKPNEKQKEWIDKSFKYFDTGQKSFAERF